MRQLRISDGFSKTHCSHRTGSSQRGTRFLEDCTEKASVLETVDATALFQSFKDWAKNGSEFLLSQTKFGVEAKKLLTHKKTNSRSVYTGIKMKNTPYTPPDVTTKAVECSSEVDDCPF